MRTLPVGNRLVGPGHPTFIIAEAGANHNRDMGVAKRLIDAAVAAGADAVKFQTYSAETLYTRSTPRFKYLDGVSEQDTWDLIKSVELPRSWQAELAAYARGQGILFMSTPFDRAAADELVALGAPAFKIASYESIDLPLIRYVASKGKPMFISVGMCSYGEIQAAIQACAEVGNDQVVLLQCVSLYPAPVELTNLRAIPTLAGAFQVPVGLSDHSLGTHIPVAAVAVGACAIEKHYTLDRNLPGPDHPFALEPADLTTMCRQIRDVESALGDGIKRGPAPQEQEMYRLARRSLVSACAIPAGSRITADMLTSKRPGYGIPPAFFELVVGREARQDIPADEVITWEMV